VRKRSKKRTKRPLATAVVASMAIRPERNQILVVMGLSVRSLTVMVTTLAVEPMGVPLPPKPAPKARAHQRGEALIPSWPSR
jgi:hypothetical protein